MNEAGQVTINGPLNQTVLCYGLIETAKDLLRTFAAKQQNQVMPAHPADLAGLKGFPGNGQ